MSNNGDPTVSVVVTKDTIVIIASDNNDNDMQAAMHSIAKLKQKRQKH
jgi:hypothetical protein